MNDADLLDLLEILTRLAAEIEQDRQLVNKVHQRDTRTMISTFRSAVAQRLHESRELPE